jgi:hypothetical protein
MSTGIAYFLMRIISIVHPCEITSQLMILLAAKNQKKRRYQADCSDSHDGRQLHLSHASDAGQTLAACSE